MKNSETDFLGQVLDKIARRYSKRGKLSGVMKLGTSLDHESLALLNQFFGISPLRINSREEARIDFDRLLDEAEEADWIKKIETRLGCSLQAEQPAAEEQALTTIISRLKLAFPQLSSLTTQLTDRQSTGHGTLASLLKKMSSQELTKLSFQSAEALSFLLKNRQPLTLSELGARFYKDSKSLRQGIPRQLLLSWLSMSYGLDEEEETAIWSRAHIYHDRLTVNAVVYGPIVYSKKGQILDWIARLYHQGEAANLNWANLQGLDWVGIENPPYTNQTRLISCENEAPFSRLMREQRGDCLLFTSGFPNSAVQQLYALLAPQVSACLHWGDTDPNGLYIASLLHAIKPLRLYRCELTTIIQHREQLLKLGDRQKERAQALLREHADFPFAEELTFTLQHGWLEQENWQG